MNTSVHYIGNHGVCYGITPNGEYFSYNPEKNGSYYHDTEEEAKLSAIKINKMLDKKEIDSIKDFNRINTSESTQKNVVKLNELQLKKIVVESVKKVLKESLPTKTPSGLIAYAGHEELADNGFRGYYVCTPNDGVKYCGTKKEAINIVKQYYEGEDRNFVLGQLGTLGK